jgi:gas vesicle protein
MSQFVVPGVILLTALLFAPGAGAQSRDDLATAARAFDESALRNSDDNSKPAPIRPVPSY